MNNGIQPTIELASGNNGNFAYPFPVYPMMTGMGNGGNGGFGFGGEGAIWLIVLLALIWGNNGNGNGGFFGGNSFDNGYAWLSNGQKDIMNQTSDGFNSLHISNQIEGVRDGVYSLSNQLCNSTSDVIQSLNGGFSNAENSANARQMANMQQAFNSQIATMQGFNNLTSAFDNCCCENRLGIANLNSTIISENCADRQLINEVGRDIITSQNNGVQRILDQLCQDKIDAKNDTISQLRQELLYARGQASQIEQTATLRLGQEREVDALYDRLSNCPVPSVPVYGRQPIFTCNNNNGCGCGNNAYLY